MKRVVFVVAGVLCVAGSAFAQPPAAGQPVTVAVSLNRGYNSVKQNLIEEAATFPNGKHDDQVDAYSQAINWARRPTEEIRMVISMALNHRFSLPKTDR